MNHIKKFTTFEAVIVPSIGNQSNINIRDMKSLVEYGIENDFDVVNYSEFYASLSDADKKTAPKNGMAPFFALFHPIRKKPMFVVDPIIINRIPGFKNIVDDIISHEKIHGEQVQKRNGLVFDLPDPNGSKYFSNSDEVMAFSWSIAIGLKYIAVDSVNSGKSKLESIKDAINSLDINNKITNMPRVMLEPHYQIWNAITKKCNEQTIRKYKKYIYLYLEKLLSENE